MAGFDANELYQALNNTVIPRFLSEYADQYFVAASPLFEKAIATAQRSDTRTLKAKIRVKIPHSGYAGDVHHTMNRGLVSAGGTIEITRSMIHLVSGLKILWDDILSSADMVVGKKYVATVLAEHMMSHKEFVRHYLISDDGTGKLFQVKGTAGSTITAGNWIEVDTASPYKGSIWENHIVDFHKSGTATAELSGGVVDEFSHSVAALAGKPGIKLKTQNLVFPSGVDTLEVYAQSSYHKGIDSIMTLTDPAVTTFMGVNDRFYQPLDIDGNNEFLKVRHIEDAIIELRQRNQGQRGNRVVVLDDVQYANLREDLRLNPSYNTQPLKLAGGFESLSVVVEGEKVVLLHDPFWRAAGRVPIVDISDIQIQFFGEKPIMVGKKPTMANVQGMYLAWNTGTVNALVGDIESYVGLWAKKRRIHSSITSLKTSRKV